MNIDKKIVDTISEVTGIPQGDITPELFLGKDLGISDIELQDIINELSQQLGITLPPEDTKNLRSVQDLAILIQNSQLVP